MGQFQFGNAPSDLRFLILRDVWLDVWGQSAIKRPGIGLRGPKGDERTRSCGREMA